MRSPLPRFRHPALPVYIVAFREIGPVVAAAALFASQRGPRNEAPDSEDAGATPGVGVDGGAAAHESVEVRPGGLERQQRRVEAGAIAEQPDTPPHQGLNLRR